ncbi:hypothetical protein RZS08_40780, partial [Arthrospira platensis SPKY1]|nr:hypothetical protein [Arthrospira platensis SPKY1]
ENWDFANVWAINPAYNDGYPYLQGQISNPTHGGTIAADQSFCQIGTPDLLSSISLPAGYIGNLLYKWQQSTQSETDGFIDIANSNAADFQPEILTTTTWFVRLARVEGQTY